VVEIAAAPGCARCASGKGCGAGVLAGDERPRSVEALIAHGLLVREGDRVSIQLAPKNLLRAALIVYGLPLTGAIGASAAAYVLGASDPAAVAMALVGAGLGLLLGRLRLRQARCLRDFTPTVTERLALADD
jgi:sigma-E factor negative regulatory protein RseC